MRMDNVTGPEDKDSGVAESTLRNQVEKNREVLPWLKSANHLRNRMLSIPVKDLKPFGVKDGDRAEDREQVAARVVAGVGAAGVVVARVTAVVDDPD